MNDAPLHLNPDALARAVANHPTTVSLADSDELWTALTAASLVAPLKDRSPKHAQSDIPFGQALAGRPAGGYGPSLAFMAATKKIQGESVRFLRVFVSLRERLTTPRTGKSQVCLTGRQLLTATPAGWGMQIVADGVKHWISPEDVTREAQLAAHQIALEQRGAAMRWGLTAAVQSEAPAVPLSTEDIEQPVMRWMETLGDLEKTEVRVLMRQVGERVEVRAWAQPPEADDVKEAAIAHTALRSEASPAAGIRVDLPRRLTNWSALSRRLVSAGHSPATAPGCRRCLPSPSRAPARTP